MEVALTIPSRLSLIHVQMSSYFVYIFSTHFVAEQELQFMMLILSFPTITYKNQQQFPRLNITTMMIRVEWIKLQKKA